MLSAEDIAAVKVAVELCNSPQLKEEILYFPERNAGIRAKKLQDDYRSDDNNESQSDNNSESQPDYDVELYKDVKKLWDENLEVVASLILQKLGLGQDLIEKVTGFVTLIGFRILIWAISHEGLISLSRDFSIEFLKSSHFTSRGIIDNKKVAEELMKCPRLNVKQRYKLACLYCFLDQIPVLFRLMSKNDQKELYDAHYPFMADLPKLVQLWTSYGIGDVKRLIEDQTVGEYLLKIAIESGSKAVVEYCLNKANDDKKDSILIEAAVETLKIRKLANSYDYCKITADDWMISGELKYDFRSEFWIPCDYLLDTLCFLFNKMTQNQQVEFLKKDIYGEYYDDSECSNVFEVLKCFLNWPYQDYFMRSVNLAWELLSKSNFVYLLADICNKIEHDSEKGTLLYGEGKTFSYRQLLNKFWCESPQHCKRYLFSNVEKINYILRKLFILKNFTNEDKRNVEIILSNASEEEISNFINSKYLKKTCIDLMRDEKWGRLDFFVSICTSSLEQGKKFKGELSSLKEAQSICIDYALTAKWEAADALIRFSALSEQDILRLKREMIRSDVGEKARLDVIIFAKGIEKANKFCEWFLPIKEENREFRKEWLASQTGETTCLVLVFLALFEHAEDFLGWCLSTEDEIKEFKKTFALKGGGYTCGYFISDKGAANLRGSNWEQVEKFLTWCFSSEDEINDFKRKILVEDNVTVIHLNLIWKNKWQEAEILFSWLGLSFPEIRELKTKTLLISMDQIEEIVFDPEEFLKYPAGDWEKLELLLRWCLEDKESALEFKEKFDEEYGFVQCEYDDEDEDVGEILYDERIALKNFYLLIDDLIYDLNQNLENSKIISLTEDFANKNLL